MARSEARSESVRWIDLKEPSEAELHALADELHLHPLDLADCKKKNQRQKIEHYKDYVFLVLLFPVYNRKLREIESGEVDVFLGPDYVVTVHDGKLPPLRALRQQFTETPDVREHLGSSSINIIHELIERLLVALYPMLDHVSLDIHRAEREIFAGREKDMVAEIALLRRNITDFRRIVQTHKNTLKRFLDVLEGNHLELTDRSREAFARAIDRTKEIWDLLESYRESIDTIHETNASLISYKLNDIMRTFTTMSVMIFIMTLVATLFAVRARNTPILNTPFAFWIILAVVGLTGIVARQFFKRKRLLE